MPFIFRKTDHRVEDDYQVMLDGIAVGSIRRRPGGQWAWKIYLFGRIVPGNAGDAASSTEAETAFRAAWDESVTPADLDWIRQRADPIKHR